MPCWLERRNEGPLSSLPSPGPVLDPPTSGVPLWQPGVRTLEAPRSRVIQGPCEFRRLILWGSAWSGAKFTSFRSLAHLPAGQGWCQVLQDGPLPTLGVPGPAPTQKAWGSPCRATR